MSKTHTHTLCVCVGVSVCTSGCVYTCTLGNLQEQSAGTFVPAHTRIHMYVCTYRRHHTYSCTTKCQGCQTTRTHVSLHALTPTSRIRVVNDCQGRGRRYHSSIYYDAYVGAFSMRILAWAWACNKRRLCVGVFFFFYSSPNFLLFLIFRSRPCHLLHTFHFHFLFVKWRRVHGSPKQRDLEFGMPFCCLLRRGCQPTRRAFSSFLVLCILYAATRLLFN